MRNWEVCSEDNCGWPADGLDGLCRSHWKDFSEKAAKASAKAATLAPAAKDTNPKDAIGDTKVPLVLLSPIAKAHWSSAQHAGMVKYGSWNWRAAGVRASVYLSALQRHFDAYLSGEDCDPVDGTHHLGNIMACAAILLDAMAAGKLTDDRPPSVGVREVYARVEALMRQHKEAYADRAPKHFTIADTETQK